MEQQIKELEDLQRAMMTFNRMYERVSSKQSTNDEYSVVYKYGRNMINLYVNHYVVKMEFFEEVQQKLRALFYAMD